MIDRKNKEEIWKPALRHYEASSLGRIRNVFGKTAIKSQIVGTKGYFTVGLKVAPRKKRRVDVHRLVAMAFMGACPVGKEVNHIDGDRLNNCAENLEYVTHRENMRHAARLNLLGIERWSGERCKTAKLTNRQARSIRDRKLSGEKSSALATEFKVSRDTVLRIASGSAWRRALA